MMIGILTIIILSAVICPLCSFLPIYFLEGMLGTKDVVAANIRFQTLLPTEIQQNL